MANTAEPTHTVRFADFVLDLRTAELRTNGHHVVLQEKPFQILSALLERPGEMVSREELSKRLWPAGTFVDFNLGLNKAVNRLREALDDSAEQPRFIETLPKRGYRFIARAESHPVSEVAAEEDAASGSLVNTAVATAAGPATPDRTFRKLALTAFVLLILTSATYVARRHSRPSAQLPIGRAKKLESAWPANAEAHEAYLMGRFYWNKRTHDDIVTGFTYFQKAVSLDPTDPHGYAGIADSYIALGGTEWLPPSEAFPKAREAAVKALALDDTLAEAHSAMGQVYQAERDWGATEKECKRALALNPSYAMAHWRYSFFLSKVGRHDEAIAEARRARELDPLLLFANVVLGQALYEARRYDEALQVLLKALEQESNSYAGSVSLASTYAKKGMFRESIAVLERVPRDSSGDVMIRALLGYACAKSGKKLDAELLLKELRVESQEKYVSGYFVSWVCIGLGRNEEAIQWLERAYREGDYNLTWLGAEPMFDPVRSDPRFADLVRRIGLPQ
jgi:DNA-binding winged helix-turn-helix (wHTH) protein/Flp pilus assembly protein TadD